MSTIPDAIRVLYVDDEPDLADVAVTFIEREDKRFTIETATSADEGLDRLRDGEFDCIISDYDMLGMNGIEFLEAVRDEYSDRPFILFTGKGSEEVASDAISAGATDYLQKGTGADQYELLANRVRNAVEQYHATRQARTNQRRLQELTESTTDCLWMFDRDWNEPLFISGYEEIWDRPTEAIEENPQDFLNGVDPDHRDFVKRAMNRLSVGESIDIEYKIRRGDGEPGWVWVKGEPIYDGGNVVRVAGFTRDITERKKLGREFEQVQARFRALTEDTTHAVVTIDEGSTIRYANDAVEDIFGYTAAEVVGESLLTLMPERYHDAHWEAIDQYLQEGTRQLDWDWIELPGRHRGGHEIELGISFGDATIEGERRFTAVIRDITEQKEREREREVTIGFLQDLYEVAADPERTFEEKIGHLLETGLEKLDLPYGFLTRIEFNNDSDGIQTIVEAKGDHELLQPGESCPLSNAYCRKTIDTQDLLAIQDAIEADLENDPAYETFELGCYIGAKVPVNDELYGTFCFASDEPRDDPFTDIDRMLVRLMSKWASYELERRQSRTELQRQNERLEEFASVVSHDLRNPLNVAEGRLELAREACDSIHFDHVSRAHGRMNVLIDDLLTLARQGEEANDIESVDLKTLTENCWHNVAATDATLTIDIDRRIQADQSRLQQLLENIMRNAIEHGGEDVTITVEELDDGFYVEDDGPGIPEGEQDDVFEAGYSTSEEGTGFGLSIVKQVADAHGWGVRVTDGSEGGARFEITSVEFVAE